MIVKAIVKEKQIIIPNYWNINEGEILIDVTLPESENEFNCKKLKETAQGLIEHWEEEIKKQVPIDSKKIEEVGKKLGLKGISVEELINGNF